MSLLQATFKVVDKNQHLGKKTIDTDGVLSQIDVPQTSLNLAPIVGDAKNELVWDANANGLIQLNFLNEEMSAKFNVGDILTLSID